MKIWVIIPAAGIGERMGSIKPKQYLELAGKTILERSIEIFTPLPEVERITVCLNSNDQYWQSMSASMGNKVVTTLGGDTRADSVLNGLKSIEGLAQGEDWVVVHDAARPCLSYTALKRLIELAGDHKVGGILAMPANDTVKQAKSTGEIQATVDRNRVWLAQTPQMFGFAKLKQALEHCLENKHAITDEASALEAVNESPLLVLGEQRNLKITSPEDLALAAYWLTN